MIGDRIRSTAQEGRPHLFGNADIKGALGVALLKAIHARAAAHRGMDANDAAVQLRLSNQRICKVVCIAASLQPPSQTSVTHPPMQPSTSYGAPE